MKKRKSPDSKVDTNEVSTDKVDTDEVSTDEVSTETDEVETDEVETDEDETDEEDNVKTSTTTVKRKKAQRESQKNRREMIANLIKELPPNIYADIIEKADIYFDNKYKNISLPSEKKERRREQYRRCAERKLYINSQSYKHTSVEDQNRLRKKFQPKHFKNK